MEPALFLAAAIALTGGISKGFSGFGYALISTSLLSILMPPAQAVALLIPSLLAANIELIGVLDLEEARNCLFGFKYYFLTAFAGTTLGMLGIGLIPDSILRLGIGILAILFVLTRIRMLEDYFSRFKDFCFKRLEPVIGLLTGVVYGSTNIGLPAVSYLESRDLEVRKFKGVLALFILCISLYRMAIAAGLGLFQTPDQLTLSLVLVIPTVVGVKLGETFSGFVEEERVKKVVLMLIAFIGLRILATF